MRWQTAQRVYNLMLQFSQIPSISSTKQELQMAEAIVESLLNIPFFHKHQEYVKMYPVQHDPLARSVITALLKGPKNSKKTVVLLSHYDVVGVEGFGRFQPNAFSPEQFTEQLRSERIDLLDPDAKRDLDSGNWLFGRGVMDMKAGLAMQIDVLRHFSEMDEFDGNLLLLATPDEETSSLGMLEAVKILNELKMFHDLTYEVCICSEANWSAYPGDDARYIYTGSVGKLLPVICAHGIETHVGEPLLGVNAGWMIGEITTKMEFATELIDEMNGEKSPLPTCLDMRVVKELYNAQTPNFAYAMFNVLTLQRNPNEVLDIVLKLTNQAADSIHERIVERYESSQNGFNQSDRTKNLRPKVFSYHELYWLGVSRYGESFRTAIEKVISKAENVSLDPRQATILLAQYMSEYFIEEAPYYLLMFAPPYYPHVYLDESNIHEKTLQDIANRVHQDALSEDSNVKIKRFYPGLSDVSYCRIHDTDETLATLEQNMPVLDRLYHIPVSEISKLNLPTLDIGPYGKDAHKWTERLEIPYSTQIAPQLLANAIRYILSGGNFNV